MREMLEEEIKQSELDMLKTIHDICEANGLRYYLVYGTLLGAIRHKGFIPWDDDIDIAMPRNDMNNLFKLLKNHDRYMPLSTQTSSQYSSSLPKVIDKRTLLIQHYSFKESVDLGVYIDVFPLDGVPNSPMILRSHMAKVAKGARKWYWANTGFWESKNIIRNTIRYLITLPYRLKGGRFYLDKWEETMQKYKFDDVHMVGDFCLCDSFYSVLLPKVVYGKGVLVDFENYKFKAPDLYDIYLERSYGDYMELPPVESRVSNHNFEAYWKE